MDDSIVIFGVKIHEFSTAVSDAVLFAESMVLCLLLLRSNNKPRRGGVRAMRWLGSVLFCFLGLSSLLGAVYHGFFSVHSGRNGGDTVWLSTSISIALVTATMWLIIGYVTFGRLTRSVWIFASAYLAVFLWVLVFIDARFVTIIKFYGPAVLLMGAVGLWKSVRERKSYWYYLLVGIGLSVVAALFQALHISIDPLFFNYNTIYHIIQGVALIFLYYFFRNHQTQPKIEL